MSFPPLLCSRFEAQTCREDGLSELQLKENRAPNFRTANLVHSIHAQDTLNVYQHLCDGNRNNKGTSYTVRSFYQICCAAYCKNLTVIPLHRRVLKTTWNASRVGRTLFLGFLTLSSPSGGSSSGHNHRITES